jgi:hypothetical protein
MAQRFAWSLHADFRSPRNDEIEIENAALRRAFNAYKAAHP